MSKLFNLARMTVSGTPGTGTITLSSAVSGYISFSSAGVSDGDIVSYGIKDGTASEVGYGTYTASGTTLTRNLDKSTSGSLLSLTSAAEVFITPSARDLVATTQLGFVVGLINGRLTGAVASNALTIAVKTLAGADPSVTDPVRVVFRNATVATGDYAILDITAATSLVISSGSTMGSTNATAFRLWIVGFNDAGTFRLGAINCSTALQIFPLNDFGVQSSTAEGGAGAADNAGTYYTGTAVTSKALRILGYMDFSSGQTTAGTWATAPDIIQLFGPGIARPGQIIQISSVVKTDTFTSSTAGSMTDITGITISVTPTCKANKIRVRGQLNSMTDTGANAAAFAILRGSTNIGGGVAASNRISAVFGMFRQTDGNSILCQPFDYIDSPQATTSTTYKIQFMLQSGGTLYINRTANDSDQAGVGRTSSTITVEELMA